MVTTRKSASAGLRLPERANLDNLRKQAKARLAELKCARPDAGLAEAQLQIARENGFSSWRALKAAFDRQAADGDRAAGDWIGIPEGGVPCALHIRCENGRLHAQFDVPALGYFGDPVESLSVDDGRMSFQVTVRAVNAVYRGAWNTEAGEWQGTFTHHGRDASLHLRRGVWRAPRIDGLDGLWDAWLEDKLLTLRVSTDDKGTFAWLSSSAYPGQWMQAARLDLAGSQVTLEMKTLRVTGELHRQGDRIDGRLFRPDREAKVTFVRREPGASAPVREAA